MSLHADLLSQAQVLFGRGKGRPRQAEFRAVSAAYYSLFHLLTWEASRMLVKGKPLQQLVARTFAHSEMKKVSRMFAATAPSKRLAPVLADIAEAHAKSHIPPALRDVAQAFSDLQQARYEADYDLAKSFTRSEVKALLDKATQALADWKTASREPTAAVYLTALLLGDRIEKIPA